MAKVTVMSADQATFRPYRWWSNWIDVAVYTHDSRVYLLQMSISKTNRKRFVSTNITGNNNYWPHGVEAIGDLVQMEIARAPEDSTSVTNKDYSVHRNRLLDIQRKQPK